MALKKPSDLFGNKNNNTNIKTTEDSSILNNEEQSLSLFENFQKFSNRLEHYQNNDEKIETILSDISLIQEELERSLKQDDLDKAMMSQLFVVETAIREVHKKVSGINQKDLENVRNDISELNLIVNEFVEDTLPKYKKLVIDTEFRIHNKYEQLEVSVSETVENITEFVEEKYKKLKDTISLINEETLSNIVEEFNSLEISFDELKESEISKYKKFIVETEKKVENKLSTYDENYKGLWKSIEKNTDEKIKDFNDKLESVNSIVLEKINSVEGDKNHLLETVNEKIKEITQFIYEQTNFKRRLVDLEIGAIKNEKKLNDVEESLLENYQKLNDVEEYLLENHQELISLREEVFAEISNIPIGDVEKNVNEIKRKINYIEEIYKNIDPDKLVNETIQESLLAEPPSTKNKDPLTPLDQRYVTFDKLQEHYRLFINRIQQQLATLGGGGETQLKYLDDIVGIATNASFYDNKYLKYNHSIKKFEFSDINSDVNLPQVSEENIIYVAKDGNDSNPGTLSDPKLTIKAAVDISTTDTVVKVAPGTYFEDNPITLPDDVTVMGHSLRETTIIPLNDDKDLFYVGNGNYIAEMSFRGSMPGKAIVAFDPIYQRYIRQSPYVQNCTNFIPDSIGMRINGNDAIGPLKSMVLDSYTQYNQGGIGVSITNEGYAQLVSLFTICDDIAVYCGSGAACDLTNSNSSFGNFGLVADGVSPKKYTGIVTVAAPENSFAFVVDLNVPTLEVVDAEYNNETGRLKVVTNQPHKFNVGMGASLVGLGFTCPFENGIRYYPNEVNGSTFNVEIVAPGRYLDAANLIEANKQEIQDKSLASIALNHPDFIFPGDPVDDEKYRYYDAYRLIQKNKQEIIDKSLASIAIGFPTGFAFPTDSVPYEQNRYYDASRLIVLNKQEIVDKSLASIAVGFPSGFYFPDEPETNERSRYYDASRLITINKQEIVDKSIAAVAIAHSDFYFPGDTQTTVRSRYYDSYRLIQRNKEVIVGAAWTALSTNYPDFNYSETKCRRDIGFFVDAVSTDVFTGGNNYSRGFVLQYFEGVNPIGLAASERAPSVYAFQQARDLMKQAITNTLVGAAYSDLTLTPDPITGSNINPNSCANVRSNIDNLVGIVTVSIGAGNTTQLPASPNLGYFDLSVGIGTTVSPGGVKCARDLSFLTEALATDIFTGGNKYSRDFTLQYFDNSGNPISNGLFGETAESVTAFNALRDYSKKAITNQLNYKKVGISSGPAEYGGIGPNIPVLPSGNSDSCSDVQSNIDNLIEIITTVIGAGTTSVIGFPQIPNLGISTTNICARDLGFLVDALATDVFTGGNKYAYEFVLQYFDGATQIGIGSTEIAPSVYAFDSVRDYARKAITNQLNYKELNLSVGFSTYPNVGTLQPILPSGNPNSCADVQYTIGNLIGIVTTYIGSGSTVGFPATYNLGISTTNICARDIGYLVDAISTDLFTGGNKYSRDFTKQYFTEDNNLIYLNGENIQSSYAFNSVGLYARKAITNQLNYKEVGISSGPAEYGGVGPNIPVLPSGNANSCADVRFTIGTLVGIVTNVIGVGTNGNINFLNSVTENSGSFTGVGNVCYRDIGLIVDAVAEDLRNYTNSHIIDATKKYFNYSGTQLYLVSEEEESITAFNAARDYMKLALNNELNIKDLTVLSGISSIGAGGPVIPILLSGSPDACSDVRHTVDTEIAILTTAIDNGNLSALPNVSLASTIFTVDVGIATQPHFYAGGGEVKTNVIRPFDGQAIYFDELFYTVKKLNIVNGGSGYTELPTITISPPDVPWGIPAQAIPILENGVVIGADMVSNGRGYRVPPQVTISSGINTAVAIAEIVPEYYTIQKSTEPLNGISIITLNENVPFDVSIGTKVSFFKQSRVLATGHSFEFIGSGTDIANCLPFTGGVPIEENETDSRNGGLVVYSSTNQSGNFKIGDGVKINQNTGSISGTAYTKSLFSTMTPFILALGGF